MDNQFCRHDSKMIWPLQRKAVYNGTFYVSMPNKAEEMVAQVFGSTWRTPDAKKTGHGNTNCLRKNTA